MPLFVANWISKLPIAPEPPEINKLSPAFKLIVRIASSAVLPATGSAAPVVTSIVSGNRTSDFSETATYSVQQPPFGCRLLLKITLSLILKSVTLLPTFTRSEERRVGKENRLRRSRYV